MKKLFRPRNLLILFGIGIVVGIVLSKKNSAPAPTYPDPWATPATTPKATETPDGEAAPSANGSGSSETEAAEA